MLLWLAACFGNFAAFIIWLSSANIGCNDMTAVVGCFAFVFSAFACAFGHPPADRDTDRYRRGIRILFWISLAIQLIAVGFVITDRSCVAGVSANYAFWMPFGMLLVNIVVADRQIRRHSVALPPPVESVRVVVVEPA